MKCLHLFALACTVLTSTAQASSPQAWTDQRQQMLKACLAASQFKDAHALGKPAEFDDQVGYSALLIEGVYPQKHMQNRNGTELCLYDRQHQQAFVTQWQVGQR
ncbi:MULTISPECIES: hypothetical protein [unclassified Pseudomonas]|uniref:hypothetical protein n=1 Tax=unclassified Pseudomonas TaxID=196821 RepID=UPI00244B1652|nr:MULTISPECIES: hypothetical protein [unclassified Pseudomonas]MDH0302811.1 hypothetical protein [Pseudomonas sp. GD04091]MDH1984376.1 hypothetical protein [Pseudomonas sp. GD03689]